MNLIVKKLTFNDLSDLSDFFCNNHDVSFFDPFELNGESAKKILNDSGNDLYYGWFVDNKIVGFGMLRWYKNFSSPTLGLVVDKKYQGFGIGNKIYAWLFSKAREVGCREVVAIVHKDNKPSMHIAKKLGMYELFDDNLSISDRFDFVDYANKYVDKIILKKNLHPKVSVCVITYNHEKFIKDTLDGILKQQVDFDYEIVLGEDCSTDNTRNIIMEYLKLYPDKFRLLFYDKNIGMMENFYNTLNECWGQYIAVCEGDDYWTDPLKLQKQINFLDNNYDYSISSHNVNVVFEGTDSPSIEWLGFKKNEIITLKDLLKNGSGGATCSLVFRNKVFGNFPEWFKRQNGGDWTLQILCASMGKMKYFSDVMGVYRRHDGGSANVAINKAKKNNLDAVALPSKHTLGIINALDKNFNYKYSGLLDSQRACCYLDIFNSYLFVIDFKNAYYYFFKLAPLFYKLTFKVFIKSLMKFLIIVFFPKKIAKKFFKTIN